MIELAVDIRLPSTPKVQRDGAVIVAALPGTRWGDKENKEFLIVLYEDARIENELRLMQKATGENVFISYPYAEYDEKGNMTKLSSLALDETKINLPDLKDPTKPVPPYTPPADAWIRRYQKGLLERAWDWMKSWVGL